MSLVLLATGAAHGGPVNLLPNGSFEEGDESPQGWTLVGSIGKWESVDARTGKRSLSITGAQQTNTYWRCAAPALEPGRAYRVTFYAKSWDGKGGGCVISGPSFANRDFGATAEWERYSFVFTPPNQWQDPYVRFGEWHRNDTVVLDDVAITEVVPVHNAHRDVVLGSGESVRGKTYTFESNFGYEGGNFSRCLAEGTAGFNSRRWVFSPGAQVTYRHQVGTAIQRSAKVTVHIGYYVSGACEVACSRDGEQWHAVGKVKGLTTETLPLPAEIFPSQAIYVRLRSPGEAEARADSAPGSFQVYTYTLESELAVEQHDLVGTTKFLDLRALNEDVGVRVVSLGRLLPGDGEVVRLSVSNNTDQPLGLTVEVGAEQPGREVVKIAEPKKLTLDAKAQRQISIPYRLWSAGDFRLQLALKTEAKTVYSASTPFTVPCLYESSFGYWLGESVDAEWWWCEGTYKVSRERPTPDRGAARPVHMSAARGEYEPVQIVLRPKRDLEDVKVSITGTLAEAGKAYCVAYHYVHRPTDGSGCLGWWPDAIPPYEEPLDLKAGHNQPIWLLVKVPDDCPAGDHELKLEFEAKNADPILVPIKFQVYDFALPKASHLVSAFGLSSGSIRRYHNLETREEERQVWDRYLQNFREHRISPYGFAPFDPIRTEFSGVTWSGGVVAQESPPEGKYCIKVEDTDPKATVTCGTNYVIPVEQGAGYLLSWWVKTTKPDQTYLITLNTQDRDGRWISGHNIDLLCKGTGQWEWVQRMVVPTKKSPNAASVSLHLRATEWREDGSPMGTAWFDHVSLTKAGTKANLIKNAGFEIDQTQIKAEVDFSAWDEQAKKYLDGYGFTSFRLGLKGMGGGTFHSRRAGRIGPHKQGTPGYRRVFKDYCQQLQTHFEENGWLKKAYVYWFDEPAPKDYEFVKAGMEEIKLAGPKLQRMLTEEPVEPLLGSVDIWCPVLHCYKPEDCQPRQKEGEQIWWYVCCGPKAPYPGLFIDHNAIELRIWLWMTWKWNVQGILVWTSNYWTSSCAFPSPKIQCPWEDPMGYVSGYGCPAGSIAYWGNGDGRFLYPPNRDVANDKTKYLEGPVSSIRWEMLREGLEDYEYFWLLRDAVAKARAAKITAPAVAEAEKLLTIPDTIIVDKTDFTRDPTPLHQHRCAMGEAIEKVSKLIAK